MDSLARSRYGSKVAHLERAYGGLINGGFFDRIEGDGTVWEGAPLQSLAEDGELMAWEHRGFWQPMDTLRDRDHLRGLWEAGHAPWKIW